MSAPSTATLRDPWRVYTLEDALTGEDEPLDWAVEGLLLRQAATLGSGHPHATKSLDFLAATLESVVRHTVWGHFKAPKIRRALFIETEDPRQVVKKRIRELAKGMGITSKMAAKFGFRWVRTGPFDLLKCRDKLVSLLEKHRPDWVVLSTLQGLIPGRNWKESVDMQPINAMIVELTEKYCPIVLITHSPHDTRAKRAAGTITQEANYLTTMHFEKKPSGLIAVTVDSKIGEHMEFGLRLAVQDGEVRQVVYAEYKETKHERIIAMNRQDPQMKPSDIARAVGCTVQFVNRVLKATPRKFKPRAVSLNPDSFSGEDTVQ